MFLIYHENILIINIIIIENNMSNRNQASITIKEGTKGLIDSVLMTINLQRTREGKEKIKWDSFMGDLFKDHTIVGGTLLCQTTF